MPYFCSPFADVVPPKAGADAPRADVAKLADAPDLGSGAVRHVGSTPIIRTNRIPNKEQGIVNDELQNSIFLVPCSIFKS